MLTFLLVRVLSSCKDEGKVLVHRDEMTIRFFALMHQREKRRSVATSRVCQICSVTGVRYYREVPCRHGIRSWIKSQDDGKYGFVQVLPKTLGNLSALSIMVTLQCESHDLKSYFKVIKKLI